MVSNIAFRASRRVPTVADADHFCPSHAEAENEAMETPQAVQDGEQVIDAHLAASEGVATTDQGVHVPPSLPRLRVPGSESPATGFYDVTGAISEHGEAEDDDEAMPQSMTTRLSVVKTERYSSLDPSNLQTLLNGGLDRFYGKIKHAIKLHDLGFPTPEIHFTDLSYAVWLSNESAQAKASVGGFFRGLVAPWRKLRTVKKTILHPMTGMISPGSLTLVLANPGAGKSTFLRALVNKLKPRKGRRAVGGCVSYSGLLADEITVSKLVGLVDQLDNHFPTLTVRETIHFADRCLNGPPESKPPALQEVARLRTDMCLHILGLTKCADTCVGDAMLRGVSGGERKRVTLGEMLVGNQSVFLCDEISTGLDSAAIFDIVQSLRSWTRMLGGSAVVALLQPPPEVVELFDDVLILAEGRLVFHGPRVDMLPYFERLGFTCPTLRVDPAEFAADVVSGRGAQFLSGSQPPESVPSSALEFERQFQGSDIYQRTLHLMADKRRSYVEVKNKAELHSVAHLIAAKSGSSPYKNSFLGATSLLLERQRKIWLRDRALVASKLLEAVCVGVLLGVIYLDVTPRLYLRMLFFLAAIFQRQAWQQITMAFQTRNVFYKQRTRNFFRTLSYTLAESLVQVPLNVAVSLTLVIAFYFMSGLSRDGSTFVVLYIIIVCFQHAISSYFTLLASLAPSVTVAQALASLSSSFFLLFSGNIILPDLIPDYWMWMHWFNPVAWTLRALLLNEFYDSRYSQAERTMYLELFQVTKGPEYIWVAIIMLVGYNVIFTLLNTFVLRFIQYEFTATASGSSADAKGLEPSQETDSKAVEAATEAEHVVVDLPRSSSAPNATGAAVVTPVSSPEHQETAKSRQKQPKSVPASLAVRNLDYFVPNPANPKEELQLLHGVTAYFAPGTMTALMGSSGAGKTTFMDVLAGRKTGGRIAGEMLVNGEPKDPETFSRVAGYCEQMDIHSSGSTIREALEFSATLRLPSSTPRAEYRDIVEGAMDLLELRPLEKELVRNCSVEQKKRVTIGVEMVANPSILFLDEPTSGLDARAASFVMQGVLSIARTGRTVICTIHQPSKNIFELFDGLLLLQKGGYTAFFGELGSGSTKLLNYFAGIPGTSPMQTRANPATYMLEVIGAGIGRGTARDYSVEYAKSSLYEANKATTDRLAAGGKWKTDTISDEEREMPPFSTLKLSPMATTFPTQFACCVKKMTVIYWRNPQYNFVRMVMLPVYAVIFGSTFFQLSEGSTASVNSHVGLMYNTLDFIGVINLMTVLDTVTNERAVFYRERMSNYYGPLPYALAMLLAELPYLVLISFVFMNVEYWLVGWSADAWSFFLFWLVFFLHVGICTTIGQLMAVLMPDIKVANVAVGTISVFFNLFSGFLMPRPQMHGFYSWIRFLVATNYSLESLVSIELGRCHQNPDGSLATHMHGCKTIQGTGQTLKEFVRERYDFDLEALADNIAVLVGYAAAVQVYIYLTLRFVSHLKR